MVKIKMRKTLLNYIALLMLMVFTFSAYQSSAQNSDARNPVLSIDKPFWLDQPIKPVDLTVIADPVQPSASPTVEIVFPPANSKVMSEFITVRGTASDSDGVVEVLVNGVSAATADNYAHWEAVVPMTHAAQFVFHVDVHDALGNVAESVAQRSVESAQGVLLEKISNLDFNSVNNTVVAIDSGSRVVQINQNGSGELLSGKDRGDGEELSGLIDLVIDPDHESNLIYALDKAGRRILEIDPTNGDRRLISAFGPQYTPYGLALDSKHKILFMTAWNASFGVYDLISIDIATRVSDTLISNVQSLTSLSTISFPPHLAYEHGRGELMLWFTRTFSHQAVFLDPVTLDRRTIPAIRDAAVEPNFITDMALSSDGTRAYVVNDSKGLYVHNLETAAFSYVINANESDYLDTSRHLTFDATTQTAYVQERTSIFSVDTQSGLVKGHAGYFKGNGPRSKFDGLGFDVYNNQWIVGSDTDLVGIDAQTGHRIVRFPDYYLWWTWNSKMAVFNEGRSMLITTSGAGANKVNSYDLVNNVNVVLDVPQAGDPLPHGTYVADYDFVRMTAVVAHSDADIISLNTSTGNQTHLSLFGVQVGQIYELIFDEIEDRYLIGSASGVITIDRFTGQKTQITSNFYGSGPWLGYVRCMAQDRATNSLLVCADSDDVNAFGNVLARVNVETGDRTEVSGPTVGRGPKFFAAPTSIDYDESTGVAHVMSQGLFAVDIVSGDRVIVSY